MLLLLFAGASYQAPITPTLPVRAYASISFALVDTGTIMLTLTTNASASES